MKVKTEVETIPDVERVMDLTCSEYVETAKRLILNCIPGDSDAYNTRRLFWNQFPTPEQVKESVRRKL